MSIKKSIKIKRILFFSIMFVITYALLATAIAPKQYSFELGDIPRQDIKAPRDTIDEQATQEKVNQALEKVDKQYTKKSEVKKSAEDNIRELFDKLIDINNTPSISDKSAELKKIKGISLNQADCDALFQIKKEELAKLKENLLLIIDEAYENNIEENKEDELKEVRKNIIPKILKLNLSENIYNVINTIMQNQIKSNFFYDDEKTQALISEAKKNVSKVIIKQNQIIVKEGEPVTQNQLDVLAQLGMLDESNGSNYIYVYLILALFVLVVMFIQYSYLFKNHSELFLDFKKLTLIGVINLGSLILARAMSYISPLIIPFACGPILLTLLVNYKVSIFFSVLNAITIGVLNGFDVQVIVIGIFTSLLGSTLLKKMQQRNELIYSTVYISIIAAILTISTGILISSNLKEVLIKSALTIVGGMFSGVLALGILPFIEGFFDEVTTLKLLELSNPNNPLLKKLLMEAPGTYHHSMLVANLSEMAAEEIGASSVIARIGSYYHDVGKTRRPYFFGENQIAMENPHNNMNPRESAKIIISHVKDGLELAQKYNLPKIIQDIIVQHHGTTLVKYFYYTMKNNAEDPESIKERDFKYPGPIPNTKESGIIMMADSVEAAVRSIKEPNEEKISQMINNIVDDKLKSGQLDNCDLTLKDIQKIKISFLKCLKGIYHHRIEYPKEKIKTLKEEKGSN